MSTPYAKSTVKPEPKQRFVNDTLVQLDEAYGGIEDEGMPHDALDNALPPEGFDENMRNQS